MPKTININYSGTSRECVHTNFGAMTRIWTPSVTRLQLKSDKVTKIWIPNVSRTPLESDKVIRIWTLNVKRSQLRSGKVTWIWTFGVKRDLKVVNCIGSFACRNVDKKWQKNKGECTLTKI